MKRTMIVLCSIIFVVIILSGCTTTKGKAGQAVPTEQDLQTALASIPSEIHVKYDGGNEYAIVSMAEIAEIMDLLNSNHYEIIELPEAVGQKFVLQLGNELTYTSPGYLSMDNKLYQAQFEPISEQLAEYIEGLVKRE